MDLNNFYYNINYYSIRNNLLIFLEITLLPLFHAIRKIYIHTLFIPTSTFIREVRVLGNKTIQRTFRFNLCFMKTPW